MGISKIGFYWHFKDRDDLRRQIVEFWAHEFTKVVTENPMLAEGDPRDRLENTMIMILDHDLTRFEVPMRAWAEADAGIARRLRQVYRLRLDYLGQIFHDLGFRGDELEMRTRLFVVYHIWERSTFPRDTKKSLRRLIRRRVALLAGK